MALVIKLLGALQTNAGSLTTIYAPTTSAIVHNIRFATATASGTVNLFINPSGTDPARRILDKNVVIPANDILVVKPEITMGPGDTIEATTSVAMDCVVSGFTRD